MCSHRGRAGGLVPLEGMEGYPYGHGRLYSTHQDKRTRCMIVFLLGGQNTICRTSTEGDWYNYGGAAESLPHRSSCTRPIPPQAVHFPSTI